MINEIIDNALTVGKNIFSYIITPAPLRIAKAGKEIAEVTGEKVAPVVQEAGENLINKISRFFDWIANNWKVLAVGFLALFVLLKRL